MVPLVSTISSREGALMKRASVVFAIERVDRLDHRLRLLRSVRVVEIDQRLAIDASREQREIRAVAQRIER